jgi:hypothetical protein
MVSENALQSFAVPIVVMERAGVDISEAMSQSFKQYKEDQFWNIVFAIVFAALAVGGLWYLSRSGELPLEIGVFDFFILTLAVFRVTRLLTRDTILQFFRNWFFDGVVIRQIEEGERTVVFEPSKREFHRTVGALLGCPWCTGIWVSLVSVFVFFAFPSSWMVFLLLAIAGLASLVQALSVSMSPKQGAYGRRIGDTIC